MRQRVTAVEPARALVELNLGTVRQRPLAAQRASDARGGGTECAPRRQRRRGAGHAGHRPGGRGMAAGLATLDGAAGCLLAAEAGAMVGDVTGDSAGRWPASGDVLAAPERLWQSLRALLWPIFPTVRAADLS